MSRPEELAGFVSVWVIWRTTCCGALKRLSFSSIINQITTGLKDQLSGNYLMEFISVEFRKQDLFPRFSFLGSFQME
jgi:hypothetical protein